MTLVVSLAQLVSPSVALLAELVFKLRLGNLIPRYVGLSVHSSLLGFYPETWQVCKLSINLLTLAGLSTNISVDKPANLCRCMVKS